MPSLSRSALLASILCALTACAMFRNDQTVCSEYRGIRCMTAPECSFDGKRGCQVCRCSRADAWQDVVPPDVRARTTPGDAPDRLSPRPQEQPGQARR